MDIEVNDQDLAAKLKRLDAGAAQAAPGFDYQGLLDRHASRQARSRRRLAVARGAAVALFAALLGASFWRLDENAGAPPAAQIAPQAADPSGLEPRIVRADTYLAVAALEDHIASIDDALNVARVYAPRGEEVARLERTRAELLDSYAQVRYAQLVSANF
jgi:hypothetical protein